MKVDTPQSFVLITVGVLPPDVLPEQAAQAIIPANAVSLALTPYIRSTTLQLSGMDPVQLIQHLVQHVPPLPAAPNLTLDRGH